MFPPSRYSSDIYDRIWRSYFLMENWTQISTALDVVNSNKYAIPKDVLKNAATPTNASAPLTMEWISKNPEAQYYYYAHFAEIQDLQSNETREFNVLWNGVHQSGPFSPRMRMIDTISSNSPQICTGGKCIFQLIRTNRSTLPPLLNALEVYKVVQFTQSETDESDVGAIKNIATTYALNRISWQGDPCVPRQFRWDGLNCTNADMSMPPRITTLNLSSSGLTGTIADAIQSLTQLETMDLSKNNLTGELPDFLGNMKSLSVINLSGNNLSGPIPQALQREGLKLLRFTYSEVIQMTNNFQRVLGKGGFGMVYHGTVNGSDQVAVKVFSQSSAQGYKEFKAEVDVLVRVHHTNLVILVGYCYEGDHLALVYEFLPNGDLKQHLSGKRGRPIINWSVRLQIALDTALGSSYQSRGKTQESTVIAGTIGYLDPEYYRTGRLAEKSDVYSYGVVLLEMITNQPVISKEYHIVEWVSATLNQGDINEIMDPNLGGFYESNSAWRALELAMSCADPISSKRPTMSQVIIELKECIACENLRMSTSPGSDSPLIINWTSSNVDNQYYMYAHFAEIQELRTNDTREFNMTWNGEHYFGPFTPPKFKLFTAYSPSGIGCKGGQCSIQLTRTKRSTLPPLLNALEIYTVIHFPQSETNERFISLDCGLPANELSPYKEASTGLWFSSDENFIQSGKNGRVQANRESKLKKLYRTLRYFPNGTRNCYNLRVEKGRNHLIRAFFIYANYDGFDINPNFDLYLGPNLWGTIDLEEQVNGSLAEILHIPISNSLQICLVKTGRTTPFISTLEIRPMGDDSYITDSGSLKLFFRRYLSESDTYIRYPRDIYDRIWVSDFRNEWTQISTTLQVNNSNSGYAPPKAALTTAATPTNSSAPLTIQWNSSNVNNQYYFYRHFAEIQELQKKDIREFNIAWNGEVILPQFVPPKFRADTVFERTPRTCAGGQCSLQLIKTNRSTLPPLLNALEVYTVIQFMQSETKETDVIAVQNIKTTYGISRSSWQGDPCVPQQFTWNGLNCSNTDISTPPRITHINLSSSGLIGTITDGIQNLTLLESL
ncbi:unnamed protein product [Eruca vesicaria subsp. sativa]|uniref:non-specific serine/threonine protein kinase n=1 Tax=Eruca vesicaria subsp. sativa TaxID=29727 RepID=A0ABC8IS79_ERUVS|nr:unnamed protein product [Eruca vesicaria subsp. sativa]